MIKNRMLVFATMGILILTIVSSILVAGAEEVKIIKLVTCIRELDNEFHINWKKGGDLFAKVVGMPHITQTCQGISEKQLSDLKGAIVAAGAEKNVVFCIDANEDAVIRPVVEACEEAGVYIVSEWGKPADMHPWDYKYWVCHFAVDSFQNGYEIAKVLFDSMGGKGDIVCIDGMLGNSVAIQRHMGLMKALEEYPDIQLLDSMPGDWDRTKGLNIMESFLVAYPDIAGVFGANDMMALGAIEALRAAGLAGKVKVVGIDGVGEAIEAIKAGEMVGTTTSDPWWQGGMGLSIAYKAAIGELDPAELPKEKREFNYAFVMVTQDNVKEYEQKYITGLPEFDYDNLFERWISPFKYYELEPIIRKKLK